MNNNDENENTPEVDLAERYRFVFDGGESSKKVLADLAAFCGADEDGFIADNERANAYMQGRLSVFLHIKQKTNKGQTND